jgi:DNA-binding response OmpR family regulator
MKILLVENHATFARMVRKHFLAAYSVEVVPTLAAARRSLENSSFDLLLVDFDLDDGKGDELMREVKARFPKLKAIAVSSHDAGNRALTTAGADAVCGKMHFDQIQSVIKAMDLQHEET